MATTGNAPQYIRHVYKITNELKSYSVYEFIEHNGVTKNKILLTEIIRIEKFQSKSNASNIIDYLRLRTATSWSKSQMITGLRPTTKHGLFYGDWLKTNVLGDTKKHLLIFRFCDNKELMFIDVYRGFYPNHKGILQSIINTY